MGCISLSEGLMGLGMIDPWSATGIRVCGVDGFDAYRDVLSTSTMEGYLKQETANALMKGTCT